MTAVRIAIRQLCRLDEHCSIAEQYEITTRRAVSKVIAPNVPSLYVFVTVRRHTAHGNVVVLSHVPHCISGQQYLYHSLRTAVSPPRHRQELDIESGNA